MSFVKDVFDVCSWPRSDSLSETQGGYKYHQYQVVGRHLPTEKEPEPTIYRMKLWATDPVRAKSKFW